MIRVPSLIHVTQPFIFLPSRYRDRLTLLSLLVHHLQRLILQGKNLSFHLLSQRIEESTRLNGRILQSPLCCHHLPLLLNDHEKVSRGSKSTQRSSQNRL